MRIENLGNDKIKVTLTTSELINLDIDVKNLSADSDELHSFLFHIMETIRQETGFNPYSGQVVVEATPSKSGISILVSRMNASARSITSEDIKRGVKIKARLKNKRAERLIFYFDNFDDLCNALLELKREELMLSALYRLLDTYCFITENNVQNIRAVAVMSEFSAKGSKYPLQLRYIKEHGSLVAKGAKLALMAENIADLYKF